MDLAYLALIAVLVGFAAAYLWLCDRLDEHH